MKKSMNEFFEKVYKEKIFVNNYKEPVSLSGPGSFPENVINYLSFLKKFIIDNNIKSVIDFGCGDFQLYKNFSWDNINYIGFDASETAINIAKKNQKENIKFEHIKDIELPKADLLLIKDVFGHWLPKNSTTVLSDELGDQSSTITDFLNINNSFKFIIIVDSIDGNIKKYFPKDFKYSERIISFVKKDKKVYINEKQ
jgi:SAM-dependent methyltransferase